MDGIDAEWITEKEYLSEAKIDSTPKLSDTEEDILRMESLDRVMVRWCLSSMDPTNMTSFSSTYMAVTNSFQASLQTNNPLVQAVTFGGP